MATTSLAHLPPQRPDHSWTRPPKSGVVKFFWRRKMWFDSTFVFTLLEPWEYFLLLSIFIITALLLVVGIIKYLPSHVAIMQARAAYYLWGQEGEERLLWHWFTNASAAGAGPGLLKEL